MISIKHINEKDIDLCYELDSNTISLWSKKQWANEFKKEGVKVFGLSLSKRENGPPSSGPVLRQHEDCFLVHIISGMTAIELEAHNGLGNEREGATMGLEVYQEVKTIHGLFRKA